VKQSNSFLNNILVHDKLEGRAGLFLFERDRIGRGQFDKHFIGVRLVWGLPCCHRGHCWNGALGVWLLGDGYNLPSRQQRAERYAQRGLKHSSNHGWSFLNLVTALRKLAICGWPGSRF
jgi:hypothetical protein